MGSKWLVAVPAVRLINLTVNKQTNFKEQKFEEQLDVKKYLYKLELKISSLALLDDCMVR